MQILVLSSKGHYAECEEKNYGDCFIIDTGDELIIYDCGSEEHALRVIEYMDDHGYDQTTIQIILMEFQSCWSKRNCLAFIQRCF